jgi:MFS family permease
MSRPSRDMSVGAGVMDVGSRLRAARRAVSAMFLFNSLAIWSWIARIPDVKEHLGLSESQLGLALLGTAVGAMIAMTASGYLVDRIGSAPTTRYAAIALCLLLWLPAYATNAPLLFAALVALGACHGLMDVAMNANGVAVERRYGRPILSSFHGIWSVGALGAAGIAAVVAGVGVSPKAHLPVAGAIILILVLVTGRDLLADDQRRTGEKPRRVKPNRIVLGLGAIAFCVMLGEGAVADWAGVFLKETVQTSAGIAATGYVVFQFFMAAGRLAGDWTGVRFGRVAIVRGGGLLAAAGMTIAVAPQTLATTFVGLALLGLALSGIVPIAFGAAGRIPNVPAGAGISMVATIGYLGFLIGPPVIGVTADATSLALALGLVVLLSLLAAGLAPLVGIAAAPMPEAVSLTESVADA